MASVLEIPTIVMNPIVESTPEIPENIYALIKTNIKVLFHKNKRRNIPSYKIVETINMLQSLLGKLDYTTDQLLLEVICDISHNEYQKAYAGFLALDYLEEPAILN